MILFNIDAVYVLRLYALLFESIYIHLYFLFLVIIVSLSLANKICSVLCAPIEYNSRSSKKYSYLDKENVFTARRYASAIYAQFFLSVSVLRALCRNGGPIIRVFSHLTRHRDD